MKVQDVMTKNPRSVSPATSVREAAQLMKTQDVGFVPVVDENRRLVGVITDRDIAIRLVADGRDVNISVREVMSSGNIATLTADQDVDKAMQTMASEKVRRVPVVDERGSVVGVVAQADIVRKANDRKAEETVERISEPGGEHSA